MAVAPTQRTNPIGSPSRQAVANLFLLTLLGLCLAACASPSNPPSNLRRPLTISAARSFASANEGGSTAVVVALSGGGARSAAFGYGVLSALAEQRAPDHAGRSLADEIVAVAGVSGGGILAAHFALHGPQGLPAFRRDFLDQDPEGALRTSFTPVNLLRGYRGGINDLSGLADWLDTHLYHGATLGDLDQPGRPRLLLHATELYNRAPFPFDRDSFQAICSDYDAFPLAHAVVASSAVPVLFAPVVLENFNPTCPSAGGSRAPSAGRSAFARHLGASQARYAREPELHYLKLLDGGLVDNLAVRNLIRAMNGPAPALVSATAAQRLRRVIIIVADASMRVGGEMSQAIDGPDAPETITASVDAMIDNASRASLDALDREAASWRERLVRWRCALAASQPPCGQLQVAIVRLSLSDLQSPTERSRILQLHNKLTLKAEEVDFLAGLGRRILSGNPDCRRAIKSPLP
ncbi:Patatin-like phospholipase [Bosea sp. 62]|uniref:patatin-like phospholipase family protein n=1 Tax=unclassified Bosea (in: a-proteobacteria) TaxID=2653178 RepID=UPI0012511E79|nr:MULTISPECIES: patatin-like phospholipase family protein [unclassified Bosea (in: a-proteobacteria)]CAD5288559.1 Patatin-like phospholipase [Bosea sp. 7B]CAD5300383.1 Patatin-like phospholipase [Bosea sp. 21B]CAD5301009.1 Patatin-like phospholipase [Bosea sp. 46]VVT62087.1 Patatin-like phospholipase [Bosea sp. EC-HK365B]VXB62720.1 Patatin-like phospholipase [Bosea sp. 125]